MSDMDISVKDKVLTYFKDGLRWCAPWAARLGVILLASAGIGLVALALIGLSATVLQLLVDHMGVSYTTGMVVSITVAGMLPVCAILAAITPRERTRSTLAIWFCAWAIVALALAATNGVLSAGAVVLDVTALTTAGRMLAPLPAALAVITIGSTALTLRGPDDAGAMGAQLLRIFKTVFIMFSSFGLLNQALTSGRIAAEAGAVAVAVALMSESAFIALLAQRNRGRLVDGLTLLMASVLGLNASVTIATATGLHVPASLSQLTQVGEVSVIASGAIAALSITALTLRAHAAHEAEERPAVTITQRVTGLLDGVGEMASSGRAAAREIKSLSATVFSRPVARALPRPSAPVSLAKDGAAAEIAEPENVAEVAKATPATDMRELRSMPRADDERQCVMCGKSFTSTRADARYCGTACRSRAARRNG